MNRVPIASRRVFRLSLVTSLALVVGYSLAMDMPFLPALFGFMLTAAPKPPVNPRGLLGLVIAVSIMLGSGLLMIPVLREYPVSGLMIIFAGLFAASYISLNLGKGPIGSILTMGLTLVTVVGQLSYGIAEDLVEELAISIVIAICCQWLVYPFFPEDPGALAEPPKPAPQQSSWLAVRSALIVFPSYLLGLVNPTFYAPIIMKSVALGQQASHTQVRGAGAELLGSTFLAGLLASIFWFALKLAPNLWMFFWWTLAFSLFITSRLYGVVKSKYPPSYWTNVMITLLILIGPAVADSANGKDPYQGSIVRMGLFIAVAIYAWFAVVYLEWLRARFQAS